MNEIPTRESQENEIIEELLYVSVGIGGDYIRCGSESEEAALKRRGRSIVIDESVPTQMRGVILKILPVFLSYTEISDYIDKYSTFESGLVCQSFCAGLNSVVKEYLVAISQIEQMKRESSLSLQKIYFLLSPLSQTLEKISSLCFQADSENMKGAALINLLYKFHYENIADKNVSSIFFFLITTTMKPYFEMLESWIFQGIFFFFYLIKK